MSALFRVSFGAIRTPRVAISSASSTHWGTGPDPPRLEDDRARDVITTRAGYRTLRFTDRQLTEQTTTVAMAIKSLLADRLAA